MRHKDLGIWQTWTWSQVLDIVGLCLGLHRLGVKRGETVAIVGGNGGSSIGRDGGTNVGRDSRARLCRCGGR